TTDRSKPNPDPESIEQIRALADNAKEFGLEYFNEFDKRQGIVHVIGPEQGFTLPGTTIVCGDSHTSTHGAFGALAHGIGTSEVEHVLATQTLIQKKAKNMLVQVDGKLAPFATAKDIILAVIGESGTAGGTSPQAVGALSRPAPTPDEIAGEGNRQSRWRARGYMGLKPGTRMTDVPLGVIWIGWCTNGRMEDLRSVAKIVGGRRIAGNL